MENKKEKLVTSKEIKKAGLQTLKHHYVLLVMICLLAALLHTRYTDAFSGIKQLVFGAQPEADRTDIVLDELGETIDEAAANTEGYEPKEDKKEEQEIANSGLVDNQTATSVLLQMLTDGVESGDELSQQIQAQAIENADNPVLGRTRGYLSSVVNTVSSGKIWVKIASAVRNMSHSDTASSLIAIFGALIVYFLYWAFVQRFFEAVLARFFLEARTYKSVPYTRFLFFHQVRRWARVSWALTLTYIYNGLWSITIIGGIIKRYSYYMVPYIVAENPEIKAKQAIKLSRDMMNGHKWDCFIKEFSFIGWMILDSFTFGLLNIFFLNPYMTASMTEYYVKLRDEAKKKMIMNADMLNDTWLYEKADDGSLAGVYAVEIADMKEPLPEEPARNGFFNFVADWFGVVLRQTPEEEAYEKGLALRTRLAEAKSVLAKESYPMRLLVAPGRVKDPRVEGISFMRNYSLTTICFLFLILSFSGWLWEVSLHLIETGKFANRGVLHGPWLPIYGTGSVIVILLLKKLRKNLPLHFFATMVLCGFVEYFTGLYLEMTHDGQKWWDYSGYFLNLDGRVCAEGLLAFGILGSVIIYLAAPALDAMTRQLPMKAFTITIAVLMCVFLTDNFYSSRHPNMGEGITDVEPVEGMEITEEEESRVDQAIAGLVLPGRG